MRVVLLSGGVGGARFARGLVAAAGASSVTVVGNVGDDLEVLGLHVSPDLDSVLYALAGLNDEERGWGRAAESWNALETVAEDANKAASVEKGRADGLAQQLANLGVVEVVDVNRPCTPGSRSPP